VRRRGPARRIPLPDGEGDLEEPNATPAGPFDARFERLAATLKWVQFLGLPRARGYSWLQEGGYCRDSGVFRAFPYCRMRAND
jgi:hypothetical protein